jgi:hypothetical protein
VIFLFVLIIALIYVDLDRTRHNFGAQFNGIGAIPAVLAGTAQLPMQHRVLVPWLTALLCGRVRKVNYDFHKYLDAYILLRWASIAFAVCLSQMWFQVIVPQYAFHATTMLAVFFMVAALYDYTDVYIEVACFAASLLLFQQDFGLVGLGLLGVGVIAGLNRETAVFMPLLGIGIAPITSILFSFVGVVIGVVLPRLSYRNNKRYCGFYQLENNLSDLKRICSVPVLYNESVWFLFVCVSVVAATILWPSMVMIVFAVMFATLLVPTRWREIRVFAPCMLGVIPGLLR